MQTDPQSIFFIVGTIFFVLLGFLLFPVLVRMNRISRRVDHITRELMGPAKHLTRALAALQESAIAAGVAYFMKKAQEFMSARKEEANHEPPRRVV